MIPRYWTPIALFVGGMCAIFASVATGEADVSFFLIIPVFSGSSLLFLLGTGLILLSFVVGFVLLAAGQEAIDSKVGTGLPQAPAARVDRKTSFGGVVLLGPIPIAFGSDRRIAVIMLILGVAVALLLIGLTLAYI